MRIKPDPLGVPRDPLSIFLLCLAWCSGLGFIVGTPTSGSLESSLPSWALILWGSMLMLGATASLLGIFWQGTIPDGLLIKRFGMGTLSISAMVYAAAIVATLHTKAILPGLFAFFFGYACLIRYRFINRAIRRLIVQSKSMRGGV